MSASNGPPGGKGGKPTERRPGKGSPWAHAKSKAASARAAGSTSARSSTAKSASSRDDAGRGRAGERRPSGRPGSRPSGARSSASRPGGPRSSSPRADSGEQWTDADGQVLEQGEYPSVDSSLPTVKLQKLLADAGLGSRRELERWIAAGRVMVNGEQATLGDRVNGTERIDVDGKALGARARSTGSHARVLLLNKSEGVICTRRDPEGRKTVFADVPTLRGGRWISVGRLDIATTGLLLLTNDGELANRMMHPSTGLDREYAVRTDVVLEDDQLAELKKGIESEGEMLRFADIRYFDGRGANHWYHVVLLEGKNHEVRRLFASVGAEVRRLKRVRYGPVLLPSWLRRGQRFELNNRDVAALYKTLGMEADLPEDRPGRRSDRRGMADRSVMIPYPVLPGLVAEEAVKNSDRSNAEKPTKNARYAKNTKDTKDTKGAGDSRSDQAAGKAYGKSAGRPAGQLKSADTHRAPKGGTPWKVAARARGGSDEADAAGTSEQGESKASVWGAKKSSSPKNSAGTRSVDRAPSGASESGKSDSAKDGGQKKDWRKR